MGKRGDRKARERRGLARQRQRREASSNGQPGPESFGIKMPSPAAPGDPLTRPDFSNIDWDALKAWNATTPIG